LRRWNKSFVLFTDGVKSEIRESMQAKIAGILGVKVSASGKPGMWDCLSEAATLNQRQWIVATVSREHNKVEPTRTNMMTRPIDI
jgi:hypothetical protein